MMGQEQSGLIDEATPPETLSARTISAVADLVKSGRARKIVVMTGAGISTAAGIPDFRSPNTGLYHNLARLNLPYAEAVFNISYFRENPDPFYVLARELYPGHYSPTISHVFISLLARKGLLHMLFTQNIDCLEREAGVPRELIVEAHGSFASQRCIECGCPYPDDEMKEHVINGIVPRCADKKCNGLVKPDIVFFGEQLPQAFHQNRSIPASADLALVMGTSLTVRPFASLPDLVQDGTPRVLFNLERVGSLGTRADDVLVLGDCDSGVRKLADELGWRDELEAEWRRLIGHEEAEAQLKKSKSEREESLGAEVSRLAEEMDQELVISGEGSTDMAGSKEKSKQETKDQPMDKKVAALASKERPETSPSQDATAPAKAPDDSGKPAISEQSEPVNFTFETDPEEMKHPDHASKQGGVSTGATVAEESDKARDMKEQDTKSTYGSGDGAQSKSETQEQLEDIASKGTSTGEAPTKPEAEKPVEEAGEESLL